MKVKLWKHAFIINTNFYFISIFALRELIVALRTWNGMSVEGTKLIHSKRQNSSVQWYFFLLYLPKSF